MKKTRSLRSTVSVVMSTGLYVSLALLASGMILDRLPGPALFLFPGKFIFGGLVILLATPVAAVATCLLFFIHKGERANAGIAAIVLAVIAAGILLS
ncbi:MAG: DUF1634 domain-containing protein [Thermovirgaceae bacterium]